MVIGELDSVNLNQVRGFFIDLDGTLADTMDSFYLIYVRMIETFGGKASEEEFQQLVGATLHEIVSHIREKHQIELPHGMLLDQYHAFIATVYEEAPLFPGAEQFFHRAAAKGIPCWIVTSAPEVLARKFLQSKGLKDMVRGIIGCDSIEQGKPHPEIYQYALQAAHLRPEQVLAIEDSRSGMTAALEADIPTVMMLPKKNFAPDWDFAKDEHLLGYVRSWDTLTQSLQP